LRDRAYRDIRGEGFDPSAAELQFVLETSHGSQAFAFEDLDRAVLEAGADGLLRLIATTGTAERADTVNVISPPRSHAPGGQREIRWPGERRMTEVHPFAELGRGNRIAGPAVVETGETGCVIPQGWTAEMDQWGALKIWRE
jgi:N-methylhydantoinase A/oxoprolinase/acetone carboxylase beta subunit